MIGILVQLAISWLIVWIYDKKNLLVLGFLPTRQRLVDFLLFFLITSFFCSLGFLMKMYWGDQRWQLNPQLSVNLILKGFWWNLNSVLFEELIFRGVLLYILLRVLGNLKAILISAAAFGIYHWFSFGVIGNPMQMVIVFLMTGTMGLLLAYAYAKTLSLYIPVGIHLGWNLTQIFIFSQGPIGNGVLIPTDSQPFSTNSYTIYFIVTLLPITLALFTNYLLIRKYKKTVSTN